MVYAFVGGAGTLMAGWVVVDGGGELVPFGWFLVAIGVSSVLFGVVLRRVERR